MDKESRGTKVTKQVGIETGGKKRETAFIDRLTHKYTNY